jgi:murein DD-endopeptidase MepM/ murein hydrolase activator NlpD
MTRAECLERAVFPDPSTSPYCLPFATDSAYTVTQSYCSPPPRSHQTRFAWDFAMPMSTEILAAREGVVIEMREHWLDSDSQGGHENVVVLLHPDETLSLYIHMQHEGVLVELGDTVPQGGLLGWIGTSGTGFPHLHFMVCVRGGFCSSPTETTVPISFSNAIGPLDSIGGILQDAEYLAGACN